MLDVSYVEVKGSEFNVLATAGDSNLGGQEFTNSIFELISPNLDEICVQGWQTKSQFMNKVKKYCEEAKIKLSIVKEYELYFDIPKDIGIERDSIFEYTITREEFQQETERLFDRCMKPVIEVLNRVKRDPHKIESLVLVGGSSYLPMILDKLKKLTGKEAYHGVSAVDTVAFGACVIGGQRIQQKLIKLNQQVTQIDSKDEYLLNMKVNNQTSGHNDEFVTSTIGVVKYSRKLEYYEDVIQEGNPIPYTKDVLIYNSEVYIDPANKKKIKIPIFILHDEKKQIIDYITYNVVSTDIFTQKAPLLKVQLIQDQSGIFYAYKRPSEKDFSHKKEVQFDIKKLYSNKKKESNVKDQRKDKNNEKQGRCYSNCRFQKNDRQNGGYLNSQFQKNEYQGSDYSRNQCQDNDAKQKSSKKKGQEIPRDIIIAFYNKSSLQNKELVKFEKNTRFPCKKEAQLTPLDVNLTSKVEKLFISLFIYKENDVCKNLPEIMIKVTSEDKFVSKTSPIIDIRFEFDPNGNFKCSYKNIKNKMYNYLTIQQEEINNFIYN